GRGLWQSRRSHQGEAGTERGAVAAGGAGGGGGRDPGGVLRIGADQTLDVRVVAKPAGAKGAPPEWPPGEHRVRAGLVVCAAGAIGTSALLLRSGLAARLPRLGRDFTCHPALILVGEHPRVITNDVGHPKSYFVDRAAEERFVLETCMYFPFVTAKRLTGFGASHSTIMQAF